MMIIACTGFVKYKFQIFASLAASLTAFLHGVGIGWFSPAIIYLQSAESPLVGGPISNDEVSWLTSIFPVGSTIASFAFGYIGNVHGRKKALICLTISQLVFWFTIIFARTVEALYFVRIVSGLNAGSTFVTIPIFVTEISSKEVRGSIGSIFTLAISIGITIGYLCGAFLPYEIIPRIFVGFPIIYFIAIYKLPETPQFLYLHGKEEEAKESLRFYRNADQLTNQDIFEEAFNELKENCKSLDPSARIMFSDYTNKKTLIIMGHGLMLGSIYLLTGGFVIINIAGSIFQETGADIDPNTSAIIVGVSHVLGSYISTLIANRLTRKNLISLSSALGCLFLSATAIYVFLHDNIEELKDYTWIPIFTLSFSVLCLTFGIMSMAFQVIAELLPQKIKSYAYAFINILSNFVSMANFKLFSFLMYYYGVESALLYCAVSCIISVLYCLFALPETSKKFV